MSVLFQVFYSLCVMKEHNIKMYNFTLENNFFIKDLFYNHNSIKHWVYKIDDVEFFVPNYGYLVLVDSRYYDKGLYERNNIQNFNKLLPFGQNDKRFKINCMKGLKKNEQNMGSVEKMKEFKDIILGICKELIEGDHFENRFTDKIKGIVKKIRNHIDNDKDLKNIMIECFPQLLHNRIGTPLLKIRKR